MIDFLDQIAQHLQSVGVGTLSTSIFVNKQPPDPDTVVSVHGRPGPTSGAQRDVPEIQQPRFQVIVRAQDYNQASDLFQQVRTALHGQIGLILPANADLETDEYFRVMRCHAEQEGGPIGEDTQGRVEFSINFIAQCHYHAAV